MKRRRKSLTNRSIVPLKSLGAKSQSRLLAYYQEESFTGPLPHPSTLRAYEDIVPGAAGRILDMAEKQSEHRKGIEKSIVNNQIFLSKRGQIFAFIIALGGIGGSFYCAYLGMPIPASSLGGGTSAGIIALFITGRRKESEKSKKTEKS